MTRQQAIDAVWRAFQRGTRDDDGWAVVKASVLERWEPTFEDGVVGAIPPGTVTVPHDADVRETLDLDDEHPIDDDARAEAAREEIARVTENTDALWALKPIALVTSDSGTYIVVGESSGDSFSGVEITVDGPWATWDDAEVAYARAGWVLSLNDFAALPARAQLRRLRRGSGHAARPRAGPVRFPPSLQPAVDQLAAGVSGDTRDTPAWTHAWERVTEWLEMEPDGYEYFRASMLDGSFRYVSPDRMRDRIADRTDDDARAALNLAPDAPVSDIDWATYVMRHVIPNEVWNDAEGTPTYGRVPLTARDGTSLVLACSMAGIWDGSEDLVWSGPYPDWAAALRALDETLAIRDSDRPETWPVVAQLAWYRTMYAPDAAPDAPGTTSHATSLAGASQSPTSQVPVTVPADVQPDVDLLVGAAAQGAREPATPAYARVRAWCEADADGSELFWGHGNEFTPVWPDREVAKWPDNEIIDALGQGLDYLPNALASPASEPLNDAMRVAFLRARLEAIVDGVLGEEVGDYATYGAVRLQASDGSAVSLCVAISGFAFGGGPDVSWLGIYRDLDACRAECRAGGALTSRADIAALSDAELLARWRQTHTS